MHFRLLAIWGFSFWGLLVSFAHFSAGFPGLPSCPQSAQRTTYSTCLRAGLTSGDGEAGWLQGSELWHTIALGP